MRNDLDLSIALLADLNDIPKVARAAINLNFVVEELFKRSDVKNLVGGGLRSVDDELQGPVSSAFVSELTVLLRSHLLCNFLVLSLAAGAGGLL